MKLIDVKLAITTSEKLLCSIDNCKKKLKGKEGYVEVYLRNVKFFSSYPTARICRVCFDKMINKYQIDKKVIWRRYKKFERKKLIDKLKS